MEWCSAQDKKKDADARTYAFLNVTVPSGFLSIFSPKPLCQSSASSEPLSFQHENTRALLM
jgi:hypothetical protein